MTKEEYLRLAHTNVESNIQVDPPDFEDPELAAEAMADAIYDAAYLLAFDALSDAGLDHETARSYASEVAQAYAQA